MKKAFALFMALVMCLSLCACGESNSTTVEPDIIEEKDPLTATKWVNVYDNTVLELHEDGSMIMGDITGSWVNNDTLLTVSYSNVLDWGYESVTENYELYFDIVEDESTITLMGQSIGKRNGENVGVEIRNYYSEEQVSSAKELIIKSFGDKVSTDIIEITVKKAALAHYAIGRQYTPGSRAVTNSDQACEPGQGGYFSCSKGRTLLCLDFVIKNNDRDILDFGGKAACFGVLQNGVYADANGYDINLQDGNPNSRVVLSDAVIAQGGNTFIAHDSRNLLIYPGQSVEIKVVCVAGLEADLNAPFDLITEIRNSAGEIESFVYSIG